MRRCGSFAVDRRLSLVHLRSEGPARHLLAQRLGQRRQLSAVVLQHRAILRAQGDRHADTLRHDVEDLEGAVGLAHPPGDAVRLALRAVDARRSEEHTSELQSLMRISYAVFCLTKKR